MSDKRFLRSIKKRGAENSRYWKKSMSCDLRRYKTIFDEGMFATTISCETKALNVCVFFFVVVMFVVIVTGSMLCQGLYTSVYIKSCFRTDSSSAQSFFSSLLWFLEQKESFLKCFVSSFCNHSYCLTVSFYRLPSLWLRRFWVFFLFCSLIPLIKRY